MDHKPTFLEFCRHEINSGGPDPQMPILRELCKGTSTFHRAMLAGFYAIAYDVSTAEYLWLRFINTKRVSLSMLVRDNWPAMLIRTERRCVRTQKNFVECLTAYAQWAKRINEYRNSRVKVEFEQLWIDVQSLPFIGRYAGIKLLRALRDCAGLDVTEPDIRPHGGWSPRLTLKLLYPEEALVLDAKDTPAVLRRVNYVATMALEYANGNGIRRIGHYELQALLCEYREMLKGNRFYPGRSHDEVLENYDRRYHVRQPYVTGIFRSRKKLFPHNHLGELNGWRTIRKELQSTFRWYDYIWSDLVYDYKSTKDFSDPVKRR